MWTGRHIAYCLPSVLFLIHTDCFIYLANNLQIDHPFGCHGTHYSMMWGDILGICRKRPPCVAMSCSWPFLGQTSKAYSNPVLFMCLFGSMKLLLGGTFGGPFIHWTILKNGGQTLVFGDFFYL